MDKLDDHCAFRTYLVGHDITASDWMVWGAIKGSVSVFLFALCFLQYLPHDQLLIWLSHYFIRVYQIAGHPEERTPPAPSSLVFSPRESSLRAVRTACSRRGESRQGSLRLEDSFFFRSGTAWRYYEQRRHSLSS